MDLRLNGVGIYGAPEASTDVVVEGGKIQGNNYGRVSALDPGNNSITDNVTPPQPRSPGVTTNIRVQAPVTVRAVGNTFDANAQGANASGHHSIGTPPCTASPCEITPGTNGKNYIVTAGKLRLAE